MTLIIAIVVSVIAGFAAALVIFKPKLDVARARLIDAENLAAGQREDFKRALANIELTFKGVSSDVLKESREEFLKQAEPKIAEHVRPLQDALKRYDEFIRSIEGRRMEDYGALTGVLKHLQSGQAALARETGSLISALKSPAARGKWGEMTLRRVVEIAGMSEHCDFEEQASAEGEDGRLRPDLIVHIPGGRTIVVDAKAPLDAYMVAMETADENARQAALIEHAQAVQGHMRRLGQKAYWSQFESAPDFVVLFIPGESFFSAALEANRGLIEEGMQNRVILATPTTLIVLLRSFALGWNQARLAENAERISDAGKDLFDRFTTFSEHLEKMRAGLDRAVHSFNSAMRSWESRIMPGARRLKELGAARSPDTMVPEVEQIEAVPHQLAERQAEEEGINPESV